MIRSSEMVLPGHPDKFCDQIADAIVARCEQADPDAYCQVEVGAWCNQVWISGGFTVRPNEDLDLDEIVQETVSSVGYKDASGAPKVLKVLDAACRHYDDPRNWTHKVNDQAICVGWAGYDMLTRFHTPEHFLAHTFREALWNAIKEGSLKDQGPDGKLLVVMAEEGPVWRLEQLLVTVQQSLAIDFLTFTKLVEGVLRDVYEIAQKRDPRWNAPWGEIILTINPNGPLLDAGPEGDNGQTGRKLTMDYFGPRIGQGGGALSGKHFSHIDRVGSYAAREAAVTAVQSGAKECRVLLVYAPNQSDPLEVTIEMEGNVRPAPLMLFNHDVMRGRLIAARVQPVWAQGIHFWDHSAPWNGVGHLKVD